MNKQDKDKAHQIGWETSKHYDPLLCKESWCEMAALDMAAWKEQQMIIFLTKMKEQADDTTTANYLSKIIEQF